MIKVASMPGEARYSLGQLYEGQKVIVRQWDGREDSVVVKEVAQVVCNGQPGIDYTTEKGGTGWCYLYQVVYAEGT